MALRLALPLRAGLLRVVALRTELLRAGRFFGFFDGMGSRVPRIASVGNYALAINCLTSQVGPADHAP